MDTGNGLPFLGLWLGAQSPPLALVSLALACTFVLLMQTSKARNFVCHLKIVIGSTALALFQAWDLYSFSPIDFVTVIYVIFMSLLQALGFCAHALVSWLSLGRPSSQSPVLRRIPRRLEAYSKFARMKARSQHLGHRSYGISKDAHRRRGLDCLTTQGRARISALSHNSSTDGHTVKKPKKGLPHVIITGLWREDRSFRFVPVDTACTILLDVFAEIGTSLDGYLLHRGKPIHQQEFRTLGIQSGDRLHWRFRMRGGEKWPRGSDTSSADPSNANAYASSSNAIASTSKHPFADSDDDWEDPVLFAELDSEEDQPRVKKPKARAPRIVSDTEEEEDQPATLYEHAVKASTISKNKGKGKARAPPSEPSSEDESASTDGEDMLDDSDGDSNGEDDLDEDQIAVDDEDAQEAFRLSMVLPSPKSWRSKDLKILPVFPTAREFRNLAEQAIRTQTQSPAEADALLEGFRACQTGERHYDAQQQAAFEKRDEASRQFVRKELWRLEDPLSVKTKAAENPKGWKDGRRLLSNALNRACGSVLVRLGWATSEKVDIGSLKGFGEAKPRPHYTELAAEKSGWLDHEGVTMLDTTCTLHPVAATGTNPIKNDLSSAQFSVLKLADLRLLLTFIDQCKVVSYWGADQVQNFFLAHIKEKKVVSRAFYFQCPVIVEEEERSVPVSFNMCGRPEAALSSYSIVSKASHPSRFANPTADWVRVAEDATYGFIRAVAFDGDHSDDDAAVPSAYWCSLASKAGADPEELVLPLYKEAHHYAALEREDNQILDLDLLHHQNPYFVSRFRRYLQKPDNVVALATATPSEFRPSNLATSSLQDGVELMIKRGVEARKAWDDLESKEFKTENEIKLLADRAIRLERSKNRYALIKELFPKLWRARVDKAIAYQKTPAGKATIFRRNHNAKAKVRNDKYSKSEKSRARNRKYSKSKKGRAKDTKYRKSDKGKAKEARYNSSEKGVANAKRHADRRKVKVTCDRCGSEVQKQCLPKHLTTQKCQTTAAARSAAEAAARGRR